MTARWLAGLLATVTLGHAGVARWVHAQESAVPRLEGAECPVPLRNAPKDVTIECHHLLVREDRATANGRTIRLAVAVVRPAALGDTPPLVMLHGGPGDGEVRGLSAAAASAAATRRMIVLYDQRGAGYSEPKLCPEYSAVEDSARRLVSQEARDKVWDAGTRACIASLRARGIEPAAYNTYASALDLIDLRRTLGIDRWDVYGGSYGSRLAQEAMVLDAPGIRAVVLDLPVTRSVAHYAEIGLSYQRALHRLFAACDRQPACHAAFPDLVGDFSTDYEQLNHTPIAVPRTEGTQRPDTVWLDGRRLNNIIRSQVLSRPGRQSWLPLLLHELRAGDNVRAARTLAGFLPAWDSTRMAAVSQQVILHLINCFDSYGDAFRTTQQSVNAALPAPFEQTSYEDCPLWQSRFADPADRVLVRSDIPTLILTGEYDERTPTEHGRLIASALSHAWVFELPGSGHGPGSPAAFECHRSLMRQFFENPTRKPDASCIDRLVRVTFLTRWPN